MSIFDALVQGVIQGLTEFLPVARSGHLSLWQHFSGESGEAAGIYSILLHLGTLLAVFIAFRKEIAAMCRELCGMCKEIFSGHIDKTCALPARRRIFLLIISLLPLCGFYFLTDFYTALAADSDIVAEGICFLLTAVLLIVSSRCVKAGGRTAENMTWKDAFAMGVMQGIAPLPGLSRSGSTISVGLIMGVEREEAVAFSFIMGIPAVLGANLLELPRVISGTVEINPAAAAAGMAAALFVGLAAIKTVKILVKNDRFTYFAWYLIAVGLAAVGIGIYEHLTGTAVRF